LVFPEVKLSYVPSTHYLGYLLERAYPLSFKMKIDTPKRIPIKEKIHLRSQKIHFLIQKPLSVFKMKKIYTPYYKIKEYPQRIYQGIPEELHFRKLSLSLLKLKPYISSQMKVRLFCNEDGRVIFIERIISTGDLDIDLSVLRTLRHWIFLNPTNKLSFEKRLSLDLKKYVKD
jgi:hypothetical protein